MEDNVITRCCLIEFFHSNQNTLNPLNQEIHFDKSNTELFAQFGTFISKITKTKKMTFGAQDGKHDDRIMSLAIALKCKEDFKYKPINKGNFIRSNIKLFY